MLPLLSTGLCHACEINSRKQVFQKAGRQGQPLILLWKVFLILEALKHETKSLLFLALKYFKYHHQTWSLITVFLLNNSSHFSPAALCVPSTNWKNFTNIISNLISNLTGFYSCLQFPLQALGCWIIGLRSTQTSGCIAGFLGFSAFITE